MTDTACSTGAERQSSLQLLKLTGHGKQVTTILSCLVSELLADSWQVFGCQEVLHLLEAAAAGSKTTSFPSSTSRFGNKPVSQFPRAKALLAIIALLICCLCGVVKDKHVFSRCPNGL